MRLNQWKAGALTLILILVACKAEEKVQPPPADSVQTTNAQKSEGVVMKINDTDLVVRDFGGNGLPVLLIHGAFAKDFLLRVADELNSSGKFRVISYERRGFGHKEVNRHPVTGQAADAAAVMRAVGVGKAYVYGHSTGGSIALQLAAQFPEQVAGLSLHDPDIPDTYVTKNGPESAEGLKGASQMYETQPDKRKELWHGMLESMHGPDVMTILPPGMADYALDELDTWFECDYPAYVEWKFGPEEFKSIKAPIQLITGDSTLPYYKEVADVLAQWNPQVTRAAVPGTHFAPVYKQKEIAKTVTDFVTSQAK